LRTTPIHCVPSDDQIEEMERPRNLLRFWAILIILALVVVLVMILARQQLP
jgi:hypothetical protein